MPYRLAGRPRFRRGFGDVNPNTGQITNSSGAITGSCANGGWDWLLTPACWSQFVSTWQTYATPSALTSGDLIQPGPPSVSALTSALTCPDPTIALADCGDLIAEQASALIQSLTNASVKASQAANLAASQNQAPFGGGGGDGSGSSGCDPSSDAFGCLGGLSWYWWAAIVVGGLAIVLAVKK